MINLIIPESDKVLGALHPLYYVVNCFDNQPKNLRDP